MYVEFAIISIISTALSGLSILSLMSAIQDLCEFCQNFKRADELVSREGFNHHPSYTALCKSARSGCGLCQRFVDVGNSRRTQALEDSFDQHMDSSQTQISWKNQGGCTYSLYQKALLLTADCFNLWIEVFTADGP